MTDVETDETPTTQKCAKCREDKPFEEFRKRGDTRTVTCIPCLEVQKAAARKRREAKLAKQAEIKRVAEANFDEKQQAAIANYIDGQEKKMFLEAKRALDEMDNGNEFDPDNFVEINIPSFSIRLNKKMLELRQGVDWDISIHPQCQWIPTLHIQNGN